jgi:hypothetical protein
MLHRVSAQDAVQGWRRWVRRQDRTAFQLVEQGAVGSNAITRGGEESL